MTREDVNYESVFLVRIKWSLLDQMSLDLLQTTAESLALVGCLTDELPKGVSEPVSDARPRYLI